jgi:FO synthase
MGELISGSGRRPLPDREAALRLLELPTETLMSRAAAVRDEAFGHRITYSRKVFVPLTQLCRDVCHYCTFAKVPSKVAAPYMTMDQVLSVVREGLAAGCNEVLLTLGEKPELRYGIANDWLTEQGYASTIEYVQAVCNRILAETGLLPHVNAGTMSLDELAGLREVAPSMGLMLESGSERLCEPGQPHFGSPDKLPEARHATLRAAGKLRIPMTTGLLIGIGETWEERVDSLLQIRDLHDSFGHIQEVIIQNFRAKPGTKMASSPEPTEEEFLRTVALARLILQPEISLQAPPNLAHGDLKRLICAGINDWGGVSPVTPDHVNPEAPWPHLEILASGTADAGKELVQRLTIYPRYITIDREWIDPKVLRFVLARADAEGLARECDWRAGDTATPNIAQFGDLDKPVKVDKVRSEIRRIVESALAGNRLDEASIVKLFGTRGEDMRYVCQAANELREEVCGRNVTYVVTRNINYTNVCTYSCTFCAFSKGRTHEALRGKPYDLDLAEISRRVTEAWDRGASEVCMQGGISPDYTGETYLSILRAAKTAEPDIHVHAFSPLEVTQGAATLGLPLVDYLRLLKEAGLGSLPGTAAEILDDEVREVLCKGKLTTDEWVAVVEAAHAVGLKTTSTIMFGHVEHPRHWARHLLLLRDLQERSGGITEFVALPFVAMEAPLFLRGGARPGPTFREAILMHAVARLVLHPLITNIQASWVKLGPDGVNLALRAGANDLGGTLMNESITRAAGAQHGQEASPERMEEMIVAAGRWPLQRTTIYGRPKQDRQAASFGAAELKPVINRPYAGKRQRHLASKKTGETTVVEEIAS